MNSHKHARLTPKGRALLVSRVLDEGWTVADASMAAGVSQRTSYQWLARFSRGRAVATGRQLASEALPAKLERTGTGIVGSAAPAALAAVAHCDAVGPWHRPHCALNRQPPMSRIPAVSNLLELDI